MTSRASCQSLPSLDLHGFRKSPAIRTLTDFLEQHSGEVEVITGSGQHSQDGPVLRTAVEHLLKKRDMTFERLTAGSFRVDADSGHELHDFEPTCTKVVLAEKEQVQMHQRSKRRLRHQHSTSSSQLSEASVKISGPSLQELAAEEKEIDLARQESLQLAQQRAKEERQYVKELQTALQVSEVSSNDGLDEVLRLSREQAARDQELARLAAEAEEALLQQALKESQRDEDEALIEKAKRMSLQPESSEDRDRQFVEEALRASLNPSNNVL